MNDYFFKPSRRTHLIRWGGTALAVFLLIYLFNRQGWQEILDAFRKISFERFLLAFGVIVVSRFVVVTRWYILLRVTDQRVSWSKAGKLTFAGLFASNFLPTTIGGDVVRLAGAVQLRIDGAISAASLVVDRLVGMAGMAFALPFSFIPVWEWFVDNPGLDLSKLSFATFFRTWWDRWNNLLRRLFQAFSLWASHPSALVWALLLTIIHQLCLYAMVVLLLGDLGQKISPGLVAGLWSVVYFITLLPISINGYGVQEVAFSYLFTHIGKISLGNALTISLFYRFFTMLASLPGVLFIPSILAGQKRPNLDG